MTIHDFDMACNIANSEVNEVFTSVNTINKELNAGDIDTALTILKFKNNIICSIDNSRKSVYGYDQRIEILDQKECVELIKRIIQILF